MNDVPARVAQAGRSSAAQRVREARERQRLGLRCITVEVRDAEVDALVAAGLLPADRRANRQAIAAAFGVLLDRVPLTRVVALLAASEDSARGPSS